MAIQTTLAIPSQLAKANSASTARDPLVEVPNEELAWSGMATRSKKRSFFDSPATSSSPASSPNGICGQSSSPRVLPSPVTDCELDKQQQQQQQPSEEQPQKPLRVRLYLKPESYYIALAAEKAKLAKAEKATTRRQRQLQRKHQQQQRQQQRQQQGGKASSSESGPRSRPEPTRRQSRRALWQPSSSTTSGQRWKEPRLAADKLLRLPGDVHMPKWYSGEAVKPEKKQPDRRSEEQRRQEDCEWFSREWFAGYEDVYERLKARGWDQET